MKKCLLASLALAAAFAITPSVFADSFGYKSSDPNITAKPSFDAGYNAISLGLSGDGESQYESLVYLGNSGNGVPDRGGLVVDISGYELNLLSGSQGGSNGTNAAGNGHFNSADTGGSIHVNNENPKGIGNRVAVTTNLTEAPEPGSLILLGTGLLFLALGLFRRAAKRPTTGS